MIRSLLRLPLGVAFYLYFTAVERFGAWWNGSERREVEARRRLAASKAVPFNQAQDAPTSYPVGEDPLLAVFSQEEMTEMDREAEKLARL